MLLRGPSVTNFRAFVVADRCRRTPWCSDAGKFRTRRLRERRREADGQSARGVHLADEGFSDGLATGLPGIPGLDDRLHLVAPRHGRRVAGLEHYDGVRIRGCDGVDDGVLAPW